jgi:VanZ family protein
MRFFHWIPALLYAVVIFSISAQSSPPGADLAPDYVGHFFEYGFFSLTVAWGLTGGMKKEITPQKVLLSWTMAVAFACSDEFHQYFVPGRNASSLDILADAVGALVFLILAYAVIPRFRKRSGT